MKMNTSPVNGRRKYKGIRNQKRNANMFKQANEKKCLLCEQVSEEELLLCRACAKKYGK